MTKEFPMTNPKGLTLAEIRAEAYQKGRTDRGAEGIVVSE